MSSAVAEAVPVLADLLERDTCTARLAKLFLAKPNRWLDGRELAQVAGVYAWRSRCSDLRKAPWHLVIENRLRREDRFVISEYRCVVPQSEAA